MNVRLSSAIDRPRDYQLTGMAAIERALQEHQRVLFVEFMGAGKTVTGAALVREWIKEGTRVLWLVHRDHILKQTRAKLLRAGFDAADVGIIWVNSKSVRLGGLNLDAPIQLASIQTLARRVTLELLPIGRIVLDEAHHIQAPSWKQLIARFPGIKMLGLTATPIRLDGKPLGEHFDTMVLGEACEELIKRGFLARPDIWTREDGQWASKLHKKLRKLRKVGGDYRRGEAGRIMSARTIVGGLPKAYLEHAEGMPAVAFCATHPQARKLEHAFVKAGVSAETLFDNDSDSLREERLARLKNGQTKVLCTCDLLSEGWDYDGCRCVIMARPTYSLARYLQWAGHCMRPGGEAVILDHAGNYHQHGSPWHEHGWSLTKPLAKCMCVPVVGPGGHVEWTNPEPVEINGKLVRADEAESMLLPCSVPGCTNLATWSSSHHARMTGTKAYCEEHKGGPLIPLMPCSVPGCTNLATWGSSYQARLRGTKAYCEEHKGGDRALKPLLPCSAPGCTNLATRTSSRTARSQGTKAYCEKGRWGHT